MGERARAYRADPAAAKLHPLSDRTVELLALDGRGKLSAEERRELRRRMAAELARNTPEKAEAYDAQYAGTGTWEVPVIASAGQELPPSDTPGL